MANNKFIMEPLEGYLTPKAKVQLEALLASGLDKDLAMALLEANLTDKDIYELDEIEE